MSIIEAIILGLLQGATEFLPISSSGHLLIVPDLFKMAEPSLTVIAVAHQGTLLAVLIYFWADIWSILRGVANGLRQRQPLGTTESRLGWYVLVGTIPAVLVGLPLSSKFDELFTPVAAAFSLIITSAFLIIGERYLSGRKALPQMSWGDAIFIGVAQTIALIPGNSRSGITISAGLVRGLDRATAARYSFLLGIPAIAGAGLLALLDLLQANDLRQQLPILITAFLTSAISGYLCIRFLLNWLKSHSLQVFIIYRVVFGLFYLLFVWLVR